MILDGRTYAATMTALLDTLTCHRCDRTTRVVRGGVPVCPTHDHGSLFHTATR